MANSRPGMKRKESPQAPKAEIDSQVMIIYQYSSVSCVSEARGRFKRTLLTL